MKKENKGGVSPVITTVLLVLIVLVLASLIVLWGTTFIPEKLSKFGNPIEDGCSGVNFDVSVQGNDTLHLVNTGDVHIYKVGIRASGAAKSTIDYREVSLNPGSVKTISIDLESADEAIVIPVLLAETSKEEIQEFSCTESSWQTVGL